MNIPINKDFEKEYKDNAWQGYSLAEMKYVVLGFLMSLISGLILIFVIKIPYQTGIYVSVFMMVPCLAMGFWRSKNGLHLMGHYQAVKYRKKTKKLIYKAREYSWHPPGEEKPFQGLTKSELRKMKWNHIRYAAKMRKGRWKEKDDL